MAQWPTAYSRFRRWQRAGVCDQVLAAVQAEWDAASALARGSMLRGKKGTRERSVTRSIRRSLSHPPSHAVSADHFDHVPVSITVEAVRSART